MQGSTPRLPAGQTEKRDWAGRETGRFGTSGRGATRRANARNPAPRGDSRKEKGPGDYPGPWCWWWGGTPHQTTIESTESKRCGLLRTSANSIEKPAETPCGCGQSSRFFSLIGHRKGCSTSSAFRGQFNSRIRNRTRVRRPTKSTPIYTHSGVRQPAVRRIAPSISALLAANNLRMRRLRLIISA